MEHHLRPNSSEQVTGFFLAALPRFERDDDDPGSQFPQLAVQASWIETFHMPMAEIENKFTTSELSIVAWKASETAYHMRQKMKEHKTEETAGPRKNHPILGNLPDRFFNEEGDLDMRLMTGEEAWNFLQRQGKRLPVIPTQRFEEK